MKDTSKERYVKILFPLEQDEDGYPPAAAETLWAVQEAEGLFRLDNIPFFATGVALGDIISGVPEASVYRFQEVVRPSGHSTLRIAVTHAEDVAAVHQLFQQAGCDTEQSHLPRLIAVDVPPTVPLSSLRPLLDSGREEERWDYEEACLGHP